MKYPLVSSVTRGSRPTLPGQCTVQGRIRFLCHGDRASFALDFKDPSQYRGCWSRFGGRTLDIHRVKTRGCEVGRVCSQGTKSGKVSGQGRVLKDGDSGVDAIDGHDDDDDGDHAGFDELSCFRGLVLDVSYRPINVVCWRRAICLEFMEKADVLEYYDQTVSSPCGSFYIPAVLRVPNLLQVVKSRRVRKHLSRKNIFFRDAFICQYCSSRENLTIDHVLPLSRGGLWTWENLVTACAKCNSRKGMKTIEEAGMKLIKVPKAPKDFDIHAIPLTAAALKVMKMRRGLPDEWRQYLAQPSSEP